VSWSSGEPVVSHIPLILDRRASGQERLLGHVARANQHWKRFDGKESALAIFVGPHAYVSPSWYSNHPSVRIGAGLVPACSARRKEGTHKGMPLRLCTTRPLGSRSVAQRVQAPRQRRLRRREGRVERERLLEGGRRTRVLAKQ
jgi:hypothetical protein